MDFANDCNTFLSLIFAALGVLLGGAAVYIHFHKTIKSYGEQLK